MSSREPETEGRLEDAAVRGVPWTILAFASSKVLGLGTTFVLARLLDPGDFGLVALATVAVGAFGLFSDLGLGGVLIVRRDLDERVMGTVLTMMMATGAGLFVVIAATSPLVGYALGEPHLPPVLAVLAAGLLLGSITWFYETIIQRELRFVARFKALLAQSLTNTVVAIAAAVAGAGVWSLVAGQLAGGAVYAVGLLVVAPYQIRPTFERSAARQALQDGRGFVAQSGLAFVELNIDYLLVGRMLGTAHLGLYSLAFRISETPYWAITEPVAKVTFPGFARMSARHQPVNRSFLAVLKLVTLVACPLGVMLSSVADPFTRTLLGQNWLPMIGALTILGLWGTVNHFEATMGWLLNSLGEAGLNATISAAMLVALIPGVVAAATLGDIEAVAWVLLTHVVLSTAVRASYLSRRLGIRWREQAAAVRPAAIGSLLAWLAGRATVHLMADAPDAASLAASCLAGGCTYLIAISLVDRGVIAWAIARLRMTLSSG